MARFGAFDDARESSRLGGCWDGLGLVIVFSPEIGASWLKGNMVLDFYSLFLFLDDREVRDSFSGFNGDYRTYTQLAGIGLTYHF